VDPENGNVLGPNQSGEVWIKTATIMTGYYGNPEATKNTIDEEGKKLFFLSFYVTLIIIKLS